MKVHKEFYEEYERRHHELWPEMKQTLKDYGVSHYSIFLLKETGQLFAYLWVKDEQLYEQVAQTDICQKWWTYMEPLMETNADRSPVSIEMSEVFYLE